MLLKLVIYYIKRRTAKEAEHILLEKFTVIEINEILGNYWKRYQLSKNEIEHQPTLGGRIMVHLGAMSVAFYQELDKRGLDEDKITSMFYKIAWEIYQKMAKVSWRLASLFGRKKRLKNSIKFFRKFPFNSPSYEWVDYPSNNDVICFDCQKCPVAEYFESKELSNFCYNTWCAFDFQLAEHWGATLERKNSIAGGATKCDFKWIAKKGKDV